MVESSLKGLVTELHCQTIFSSYGILLSKPISQDSKYDFIADINHKLIKIQCKTASVGEKEDFIQISTYTTNIRSGKMNYYEPEDVDYFYTYYNGVSYLIPFDVGGKRSKTLRFKTFQNFINPNINWAKDFELEKILKEHFNLNLEKLTTNVISSRDISIHSDNKCIDCGAPISLKAKRCQQCNQKYQRRVEKRPDRQELKKMIRNTPFTQLGTKYGVSDNAIRKWCILYNLPSKKKDINNLSNQEWEKI